MPLTRFQTIELETPQVDLKQELREGLTSAPRKLPCKWFYDEAGSALFEQICDLPEYYLTRTEHAILEHQSDAIIEMCPSPLTLVELGSGSATKTRLLIEAALRRQANLTYYPIDVSAAALEMVADGLLPDFDNLDVEGICGEFASGLEYLFEQRDEPHLIAFLGSTIGNLTVEEMADFFGLIRRFMRKHDRFLLGFDLLKDKSILIPAYNDAQGVTAQFNLNLLQRLNEEFDANFELSAFEHKAVFNAGKSRIEMHLVSKRAQRVEIPGLDLDIDFAAGETIHTENSHKHSRERMIQFLKEHSLNVVSEFVDAKRFFCLMLIR